LIFSETFKPIRGDLAIYQHIGGELVHGKIVGGEVINKIQDHNLIVDTASTLMAGRMAPGSITGGTDEAFAGSWFDTGLVCVALGVGILQDPNSPYDAITNPVDTANYDILNPPEPTLDENKLLGEIYRKRFTSWCFQAPDGSETDTVTNVLLLDTTFYENEACGPLSEIAIFGGDAEADWNNGAGKDSGLMFNKKVFPCVSKGNNHRISVRWKLTF